MSETADRSIALTDLLARVEGATGPDPRLDGEIDVALNNGDGEAWPSRVTASLDAALALVERVLPGSSWTIGREDAESGLNEYDALIWPRSTGWDFPPKEREAFKTPALALLAALLKALLSQAGDQS